MANLNIDDWGLLAIVFVLLPVNYMLESGKWYILVNSFEKHSFNSAFKGILTGTTAGIITPARIGDYVGKMIYIQAKNNFKAIWANFVSGIALNIVVIVFGLFGLVVLLWFQFDVPGFLRGVLIVFFIVVALLLILLYYNLSWLTKLKKILPGHPYFKKISQSLHVIHGFNTGHLNKVLLLSIARFLIFLIQYVLILRFWGVEIVWQIPFSISIIYLIQTLIPIPPLMSLLLRGEIALIFLGLFTDNNMIIVSAAFSLWIINLLIPALTGLILYYRANIMRTFGYEI